MEEKQAIQIYLDEIMESLWRQIQTAIKNHNSATEEKRRVYLELMEKDKKGLAEVVENNKKIAKLTVSISWNFVHGVFCSILFFEVLVTEYIVHRK